MAKISKKIHLPKFSNLGKLFKRKKGRKSKNKKKADEVSQNGRPTTPTCLPEYSNIHNEFEEKEEEEKCHGVNRDLCGLEERKMTREFSSEVVYKHDRVDTTLSDCLNSRHVEENVASKEFENRSTNADIIVHCSEKDIKNLENHLEEKEKVCLKKEETETRNKISEKSKFVLEKESEEIDGDKEVCESIVNVLDKENIPINVEEQSTYTPEKNSKSRSVNITQIEDQICDEQDGLEELVYPVLIKTPTPFTKKKTGMLGINGCAEDALSYDVPCTVVVHTPVKNQLGGNVVGLEKNDQNTQAGILGMKMDDLEKLDGNDDFVLQPLPSTPPPLKQHHRGSKRVSTVKKIRSIISTPYKRIKRESSLLDGQTYRYIEIQSLVNAFQTLHPCNSGMVACNEKGLQYGKSSVLRIECRDCSTKVFLQASKS